MLQAGDGALRGAASSGRIPPVALGFTKGVGTSDQLSPVGGSVYRFEDVEVDPSRGCLTRGGIEQHLRQQSFHLLLYLIGQRHRLVGKEELIESFWQDAAVTDNALVQCIKEIRKALGDDPHEPRFIRTIHKLGYRFIANVTEEPRNPAPVAAPEPAPRPEAAVPDLPRFRPRRRWILLALAAALALAGWVALPRSTTPRVEVMLPRLPGKKALAVMYFENESARQDLKWLSEGLTDMFITDLARFDRLTVLSREQLHLLLERTGHKAANGIRLDDALDVARKSHAEGVLLGSFIALGEKIVINVRLFETAGGQLLVADQFAVDQPGEILSRVDLVSPKLAAYLGTPTQGAGRESGLAEAMTRNLEAYRYYSLGVSKAQSFQNVQARALLHKAIQLDPQFAMAYARIGYSYSVTDFVPEKGRPFLARAIQLSDRLMPKDRLYVAAWYAIARLDYAGAIRTLQQILDQYPLETEAYTRLSRLLYREERPRDAIAVIQRGIAVDPEYGDLFNVLGICYLGLGRYPEAIAAHQRYVQLAPNQPNPHDSLGMSYQQSGKYELAAAEYNAALSQDPEFEPAIIHLGDIYFQQGRYREAIHQYQRYIEVTGSDAARAVGHNSIAHVYESLRDFSRADQAARNEDRYAKGAGWNSLMLAMERGDTATAARLKERFLRSFRDVVYPERGSRNELRSYDYYLGTLALRERQPDQAISHFQAALRHLPPSSGMDLYEDCLANAYFASGHVDEAIREYQRILRLNPNYPLTEYHLAESYRRSGQTGQARAAYQQFLQVWKGADADVPEVVDAKRELLKLSPAAGM